MNDDKDLSVDWEDAGQPFIEFVDMDWSVDWVAPQQIFLEFEESN